VRGVINLRGAVLPVIDLAAKFGHEPTDPTRTTCVVVVETRLRSETIVVGLMADAVSEVLDLSSDQKEPAPSFGTNVRVDFLSGMGKLDNRLILLLDIDRILSPVEAEEVTATISATETAA
jgi:purine-binding chemotaxis protein CheW